MRINKNISLTQRYHSGLWWVMIIFFLFLTLEQFMPTLLDGKLPFYGVLFIIVATLLRAVMLAIDFHRANEKINSRLSLTLILFIGLAALAGFIL